MLLAVREKSSAKEIKIIIIFNIALPICLGIFNATSYSVMLDNLSDGIKLITLLFEAQIECEEKELFECR